MVIFSKHDSAYFWGLFLFDRALNQLTPFAVGTACLNFLTELNGHDNLCCAARRLLPLFSFTVRNIGRLVRLIAPAQ